MSKVKTPLGQPSKSRKRKRQDAVRRTADRFGRTDVDMGWFDTAVTTLLMLLVGIAFGRMLSSLIRLPAQAAVRATLSADLYKGFKALRCCTSFLVVICGAGAIAVKQWLMDLKLAGWRVGVIGLIVLTVPLYFGFSTVADTVGRGGKYVMEGTPAETKAMHCRILEEEGLSLPDYCTKENGSILEDSNVVPPAYVSYSLLGTKLCCRGMFVLLIVLYALKKADVGGDEEESED